MKKIILTITLIILLTLTSCTNNKIQINEPRIEENKIIKQEYEYENQEFRYEIKIQKQNCQELQEQQELTNNTLIININTIEDPETECKTMTNETITGQIKTQTKPEIKINMN